MCEHAAKPATTESKFQIEVPKSKIVLGNSIRNSGFDFVLGTPIWNSGLVDFYGPMKMRHATKPEFQIGVPKTIFRIDRRYCTGTLVPKDV
jgi:hypothetical protein